jgi:carbonic anhydrase
MDRRLELQHELEKLGMPVFYSDKQVTVSQEFLILSQQGRVLTEADDTIYRDNVRYQVKHIRMNPASDIFHRLVELLGSVVSIESGDYTDTAGYSHTIYTLFY